MISLQKGTKIDRFIIEKALNIGGTASIYLALVEGTNKKVAIKFANIDDNMPSHEEVLLQWEAELLQRWDWRHPGILRVYPIPLKDRKPEYVVKAIDIESQPWYMAMEHLQGGSLDDNLKNIQNCPLEWKLELFYQMLLPLAFIHQKGYAHRDIKPSNVVFRYPISPDKIPEPVYIDFALATSGEEQRTIIDNSYTLEYASPERIIRSMPMGDETTGPENVQASDVWSLGVILYEILTGKLLFKGNRDKIRTTIIREQMKLELPITDERGHVLGAFIRAMLNKEPERRPSIKEVIYALEEKFLPPRI